LTSVIPNGGQIYEKTKKKGTVDTVPFALHRASRLLWSFQSHRASSYFRWV